MYIFLYITKTNKIKPIICKTIVLIGWAIMYIPIVL